ncbi:MAG: hypothetical protein Q9171_006340 [Xanthocarpia ochracea]
MYDVGRWVGNHSPPSAAHTSISGEVRSAPIDIPICETPTSKPIIPLTGREHSFGCFFPHSPGSHSSSGNRISKTFTPSPDVQYKTFRPEREQFTLSPISRRSMKADRGVTSLPYTPSSPLSPTVPVQSVPTARQPQVRPSSSSKQGRRQPAALAIPSLPAFHPANFESRKSSPRSSRPGSSSHGRQVYDAYKQVQQHQDGFINSARNIVRNAGNAPLPQPSSPRLNPLGSPGPITPLTLEEQSDYFVTGPCKGSTSASKGYNERREIMERMIGLERANQTSGER